MYLLKDREKGKGRIVEMTNSEAINLMKLWRASVEMNGAGSEHLEAFDMAIEALEGKDTNVFSKDSISRQAAKLKVAKVIWEDGDSCYDFHDKCVDCLDDLPSAQLEPPKIGKWIYDGDCYICNQCKSAFGWWADSQVSNYCPNCGAKMAEQQESEDKE